MDAVFCCDDLERPFDWLDWSIVELVNHHTAHAAAAFYTAPHDRSTLLVVDGHGSALRDTPRGYEVETISIGWAESQSLTLSTLQTGMQKRTSSSWRYVAENSIGWFYNIVSMALGFGPGEQGKAMGLAGYGTGSLLDPLSSFVDIQSDGRFYFDPYAGIWDWLNEILADSPHSVQIRADLAFALQEIFVEAIVAAAREAHRQAPSDVLSFGGGCALNTLANTRILRDTPFEEINVFPAAGDSGLSVGAALFGAYGVLNERPPSVPTDWRAKRVYTGREYTNAEISAALADAPVTVEEPTDLALAVAQQLVAGTTVAVCRGRSELGPRALGNRSLLALPSSAAMRDHININIKQRESFRPLAPVVPLDSLSTYFTGIKESPFMLLVAEVRACYHESLAAVTHVDGSARVQTLREQDNPFLYSVLGHVGRATGIPVLLNTSLNLPGVPIVETPSDGLEVFIQRPIGALVLGDVLAKKYSPWVPLSVLAVAATADPPGT